MKKRILSIILAVVMIVCMIPLGTITASAATTRCGISANWQGTSSWQSSGYYYLTDNYTITKSGTGNVAVSGTLYLDLNGHTITFKGSSTYSAIDIINGSTLYLYDSSNGNGAIKRDSSAKYDHGVYVENATFVMNGGTISGFKNADDGGGVRVYKYGSFTMNGGRIYDNAASNSGGGVGVSDNSSFKMTGGSIYSNNTRNTSQYAYGGGGVAVWYGSSFEMTGGDIYSNNTVQFGGGVMHNSTGEFKMSGGRIDWNTANGDGGGIYCCGGSLTMSEGYIYSNSATYSGGGVAICSGVTFNMSGGNIYSNKTTTYRSDSGGGGVALWGSAKFNMTGGKLYDNSTVSYGGAIMSNNDNTKVIINGGEIGYNSSTGYTSGIRKCGGNGSVTYTKGRFYTGISYNPSPSGTSNITLNRNGGSGGTDSVSSQSWNAAMKSATMPTRTGYTFNGYYNATSGGDQYYTSTGASARNWDYIGAQTLYAQWTPITYTIAYDTNGGEGTYTNIAAKYGTSYTLSSDVPTRTGYTFKEWNTAKDGTDKGYQPGATVSNLSSTNGATVTLYAQWTANTYTVTLDGQSATTAGTASVSATYNSAMPSATMPTKTGYAFNGYFDATTDGTQYYKADGSSASTWNKTAKTTLYAQWTANTYTVTLDGQGATTAGTASVTATYNAAMPVITVPTKANCVFLGYFDATSGGNKYYNANGTSAKNWDKTSDTTLYAQWNEQIAVPTVGKDNMFLYTGKEITALSDTGAYTVENGIKTATGKYTATLNLKDGYVWSDGKNEAKTVEWYIVNTEYYLTQAPKADGTNGKYNQRAYYMDGEGKRIVKEDKLLGEDGAACTFKQWYLRTMVQCKDGENGGTDVRFISMLNGDCHSGEKLMDYEYAGFEIKIGGTTYDPITLTANEGYTSFLAAGKEVSISEYSNSTDFFFLKNTTFAADIADDTVIKVKPFVKLMNSDNPLYGAEVEFTLGQLETN